MYQWLNNHRNECSKNPTSAPQIPTFPALPMPAVPIHTRRVPIPDDPLDEGPASQGRSRPHQAEAPPGVTFGETRPTQPPSEPHAPDFAHEPTAQPVSSSHSGSRHVKLATDLTPFRGPSPGGSASASDFRSSFSLSDTEFSPQASSEIDPPAGSRHGQVPSLDWNVEAVPLSPRGSPSPRSRPPTGPEEADSESEDEPSASPETVADDPDEFPIVPDLSK